MKKKPKIKIANLDSFFLDDILAEVKKRRKAEKELKKEKISNKTKTKNK